MNDQINELEEDKDYQALPDVIKHAIGRDVGTISDGKVKQRESVDDEKKYEYLTKEFMDAVNEYGIVSKKKGEQETFCRNYIRDIVAPDLVENSDQEYAADIIATMANLVGLDPGKLIASLNHVLRVNKVIELVGVYPETYQEYIRAYCETNKIQFFIDDTCTSPNPQIHSANNVANELTLISANYNLLTKKEARDAALEQYIDEQMAKRHSHIYLNVQFSQSAKIEGGGDFLDLLIETIVDEEKTDPALARIAIQHFIWQVKRKMIGLPVCHHLMPVFFGRSGIGKSYMIDHLVRPVKEAAYAGDFSIFSDDRLARGFEKYRVMVLDEMGRASATDQDLIKNKITASKVPFRPMYTNRTVNLKQNCSFIGSSNSYLSSMIWDTTGTRRFFEIELRDSFDWDIINGLTHEENDLMTTGYIEMWQAINEHDTSPIEDEGVLEAMRAAQDTQRARSLVEDWIDAEPTTIDNSTWEPIEKGVWMTLEELYLNFKSWAHVYYEKAGWSKSKFKNEFLTHFDARNRRISTGRQYAIAVDGIVEDKDNIVSLKKRMNKFKDK